MLARNSLFIAVCLAGAGLVANTLLRRERLPQPRLIRANHEFAASLDAVNTHFHQFWQDRGLEVAPRANDLIIARRLSLALIGTAPSLEEIRALEAVPPEHRMAWWTSHL